MLSVMYCIRPLLKNGKLRPIQSPILPHLIIVIYNKNPFFFKIIMRGKNNVFKRSNK